MRSLAPPRTRAMKSSTYCFLEVLSAKMHSESGQLCSDISLRVGVEIQANSKTPLYRTHPMERAKEKGHTCFPPEARVPTLLCPSCFLAATAPSSSPSPCNSPPKFRPYGYRLAGPSTARCSSPPWISPVLLRLSSGAPSSHCNTPSSHNTITSLLSPFVLFWVQNAVC